MGNSRMMKNNKQQSKLSFCNSSIYMSKRRKKKVERR